MTDDMMNLQALVGKTADSDFLREMIGFAAQRLMSLEVGGLTGAGYGEKSDDRLAQRNGYRERDWETRAGTVELWIGVQSGTPPVPPASNWNETAIADWLGVPPDADLDHPCRF